MKHGISSMAAALKEELGTTTVGGFNFGEMKFPEAKIGEVTAKAEDWLAKKLEPIEAKPALAPAPPAPAVPPKIPLPPPLRPRMRVHR